MYVFNDIAGRQIACRLTRKRETALAPDITNVGARLSPPLPPDLTLLATRPARGSAERDFRESRRQIPLRHPTRRSRDRPDGRSIGLSVSRVGCERGLKAVNPRDPVGMHGQRFIV